MTLSPRLNPRTDPQQVRRDRDLRKVKDLITFIESQPELNLRGIADAFGRTLQPKEESKPRSPIYAELETYHGKIVDALDRDNANVFENRQGVLTHLYRIRDRAA